MNKKIDISGIILLILSLLLVFGTAFVFHACGEHDSKIPTCHWAEHAVIGIGCVMAVISLMHLVFSQKAAFSLSLIPAAILSLLTPGVVIDICKMADMHCRAAMRPFVVIISIVIIVTAAADAFLQIKKGDAR